MSYRIAQDFEYAGNDYWRWSAWIEANDTELDDVREVVWILHPTFKQSRVTVTDRSSKFQLKTAGWGTFVLRADVVLANGEKRPLTHTLRLEYPPSSTAGGRATPEDESKHARPLTVFLSYSTQDSRTAAKYRDSLQRAGFAVMDQTRLEAGSSWTDALRRMISQADAVVGLVGDDEISPWVSSELEAAVAEGKPAFALLSREASAVGIPSAVHTVQADANTLDAQRIGELLRSSGST
jgi:hypothetical protein